jgi:predicted dehydrogenase
VEDAAFGFIVMKNGAVISLEASWALNIMDTDEAKCTLCGTEGGADMRDGLRINGEKFGKLYDTKVLVDGRGVAFFDAARVDPAHEEMKAWISAIRNNTDVVVKPEQAYVVSQILEAIYESNSTGKPVEF